jgi:hypothetical protein
MQTYQILINGKYETFYELALAVQHAMANIGIYVPIVQTTKQDKVKDVNIYIHGWGNILNPNAANINIQTEQYAIRKPKKSLKRWTKILELFPSQVQYTNTVFFPIGYSKKFDYFSQYKVLPKSIFTFGALTLRRKYIIKKHNIQTQANIYGNTRDKQIVQAQININIHPYNNYMFAPLRSALIISKGKLLLQEQVTHNCNIYQNLLYLYNVNTLSNELEQLKSSPKLCKELGEDFKATFQRKHDFNNYFFAAVKGIINGT